MNVNERDFIQIEKRGDDGCWQARLEKNDDMVGRWKYTDIVLGPELLLIDVYYNYLINRPKFASIWR